MNLKIDLNYPEGSTETQKLNNTKEFSDVEDRMRRFDIYI